MVSYCDTRYTCKSNRCSSIIILYNTCYICCSMCLVFDDVTKSKCLYCVTVKESCGVSRTFWGGSSVLLKSKFDLDPEVTVNTSSGRKKSVTFSLSKNANILCVRTHICNKNTNRFERINGIILIPTILSPILCESLRIE